MSGPNGINVGSLLTAQAGRVLGVPLNGVGVGSAPALNAPEEASSSEEEVSLKTIIRDRPKPRVVREFMRANLGDILGEDEEMFA